MFWALNVLHFAHHYSEQISIVSGGKTRQSFLELDPSISFFRRILENVQRAQISIILCTRKSIVSGVAHMYRLELERLPCPVASSELARWYFETLDYYFSYYFYYYHYYSELAQDLRPFIKGVRRLHHHQSGFLPRWSSFQPLINVCTELHSPSGADWRPLLLVSLKWSIKNN